MTEDQELEYAKIRAQSERRHDKTFEALGWMQAECVALMKKGIDPATVDIAPMLSRARKELELDEPIDFLPMPPDVEYARKMLLVASAYLKSNDPEFDADKPFVSDKLDFCERLRAANVARDKVWNPDKKISLSFRGNELGGETGEAQNILKKLDRERLGLAGSRATVEELADELADIWICTDLVAMEFNIKMPQAVAKKFNKSSDKVGISVKLDAGESE